jgi:Spy/CpxP family protein refolding chaperone
MNALKNLIKPTFMKILLALIFIGSTAYAQHDAPEERYKEKREKIKAQKIAFITDKLDLSPETAQEFWPVYNQAEELKENEVKEFRKTNNVKEMNLDKMNDEELMQVADNFIIHKQKINELDKIYHAKYKSILTPKQIIQLYESEKEFKLVLLKQIRERQRPVPHDRRY